MQTILQLKTSRIILGLAIIASQLSALEIPRRADDLIDSIGLNAHIDAAGSAYREGVIGALGLRHVRSNVKPGVMLDTHTRLQSLYANYGIRVNLVCDTTEFSPAQYRDLLRGEMFASIEGLNEPDVVGPRSFRGLTDNWGAQTYAATLGFQQELALAVLSDPLTASKAILSPAMANPANSRYLRGATADFIAMHSYPGQEMPTGGFLTSFVIPSALLMVPSNTTAPRLIATETGYRSGGASGDISSTAARKYVPRIFAEYFRLGVMRTFLFELTDTVGSYNFGILDVNYAPKPAYYALKNLIALLSDSAWNSANRTWEAPADFNPGLLDYTISGGTSDLHHVLLQKSNGKVYLLLWNEVPSYDLNARVDLNNASVAVDLAFAAPVDAAALYHLDSTSPVQTFGSVSKIRVNVPDEVVVLEITPGTVAVPAALVGQPVVAASATVPKAVASSHTDGQFLISRSGSTASSLDVTVSYSGTAVSGLDFSPLPTTVTIPAGAAEVSLSVHPLNLALVGRKGLTLTVESTDVYGAGAARSATVYFGEARTTVANFDTGIAGWVGNAGASTAWTTTDVDAGQGALRATLAVNGTDRWINNFQANFATPQDWSAVSKLELRIKESPSNPLSNIGKPVYFAWHNNGVGVGGGYGVGKIPLDNNSSYRTVTIDLRDFPRDRVTALVFYVDGAVLAPGNHVLFLDSLTAVTSTNGVIDDFEASGASSWNSGVRSTLSTERTQVDTGGQALAWTYNDDGATRWDNHVKLDFPQAIDLSQYSTLAFRFKEDAANPASDVGVRVYVDYFNNGGRANGDNGVTSYALRSSGGYRTIEVNLTQFGRDKVNAIFLYVDGDSLSSGRHVWYIDNVLVY